VNVQIRLFAMMAQHARTAMLTLDLPEGARAQSVKAELEKRYPRLPWPAGTLLAINQQYAAPDARVAPGDEIAIIPPVSGG
jgi:molybdopterin synthase catalytic subunit